MSYHGKYWPKNQTKCLNFHQNVLPVCYRSLWERKLMVWLDENENVEAWGSEIVIVPYISKADRKWHRYFIDFIVQFRAKNGENKKTLLIEVKPEKQSSAPVLKENSKITRRFKKSVITYAINDSKWEAAKAFAEKNGWKFEVWTERELKQLGLVLFEPKKKPKRKIK